MMDLETLQEMWKTDSKLDDELHDDDSLHIPQLHMKYSEELTEYVIRKIDSEQKLKVLVKEKWLYYKGKAPASVYKELPFDLKLTSKEEINMFIEGDSEVSTLKAKIDYLQSCINYIESILRMINNRTYHIKNAIEWKKFKAGF